LANLAPAEVDNVLSRTMPLLAFLASNPNEVAQLTIEQIVTMAGDGNLRDNSPCCTEFREYLKQADSVMLGHYVERCLSSSFSNSGFVFQDLARGIELVVPGAEYLPLADYKISIEPGRRELLPNLGDGQDQAAVV
jgi:hypothetical protein